MQSMLRAIAQWSLQQGTRALFLSVEEANEAARALYANAGFTPAYAYRYYRKGQNGSQPLGNGDMLKR